MFVNFLIVGYLQLSKFEFSWSIFTNIQFLILNGLGEQILPITALLNLNLDYLYFMKLGPIFVGPAPCQFTKFSFKHINCGD